MADASARNRQSPKPQALPRRSGLRPPTARQAAKNAERRRKLIEAAGVVVGRHGYAGASIARITAEAGVAHGAFYLHFANQQALFDVLLPELGGAMLDSLTPAIKDSRSLEEIERRGLTANFEYLVKHPEIYRVMNEAELYAPAAFRQHLDEIQKRYVRSLRRSRKHGDLRTFSDDELETVAALLTGARSYLLMMFCRTDNTIQPLDPARLKTYLDVFFSGLRS
ncbi:TetR/AcrR family transcriptional regulator [Bradyrhizobium sp. AS23.2]|uniref:TetR/AcrR family transcriptional regulator n=1 Tax=Bradyrhizobium sp. AS23.2 TaxID=1680155 RepID=UPI00093DD19C|nr:TetR/AcrR family transcriptional regulator [Bradyrhizobium sp. AS23.2]